MRSGALLAAAVALSACSSAPNLKPKQGFMASTVTPAGQAAPGAALSVTPEPDAVDLPLHTVRRLSFGMTPEMLARAREIGLDAYLEEQFDPAALQDERLEREIGRLEVLNSTPQELFEMEDRGTIFRQFIYATLKRQVENPAQVYELLVDFWSNHFNIFIGAGVAGVLKVFDDRDVIRPLALSTFPELLQASAHSPAMLAYLDQAQSRREAPNENYARELLELHSLGVDGGYEQADVEALARVLTGWSIFSPRDREPGEGLQPGDFIFRPYWHDDRAQTVVGIEVPAGSGLAGGEALVDALAHHPSTARFISRKLAVRFVADSPPETLVDTLAETFLQTGGDVRALLRALVASPEFAASAGAKIKRPLEYFVSLLRATGARLSRNPRDLRELGEVLRLLGQIPYNWSTPDGYPDQASWWLTTNGLLTRWNLAFLALSGELGSISIDLEAQVEEGGSAADAVDLLSLRYLGEPLPADARAVLLDLAAGYDLHDILPGLAALILSSPYFQVR